MKADTRNPPPVTVAPAAFTTKGAANYTGASDSYLTKARMDPLPPELKDMPPGPEYFRFGRHIRYSRQALDEWLAGIEAATRNDRHLSGAAR